MTTLAVFTRDLRVADNPILDAEGSDLIPLFVADPRAETAHGSANRQAFLAESLDDLDGSLRSAGSSLVFRRGPWTDTVAQVAHEARADRIVVGRDVSFFSQERVRRLRHASQVPVDTADSITVVPPDAVSPTGGTYYQVFTPYYRRWLAEDWRGIVPRPRDMQPHGLDTDPLPTPDVAGTSPDRLEGGEKAARLQADIWMPRSRRYADSRNDLAADGTSRLSAGLHFGTLSPLELALQSVEAGADAYLRQLAWRDFNAQVLYHSPSSSWSEHRGGALVWRDDPEGFRDWTEGMTGFPVVDAGMRQLAATGFMHNRARMIVASFLTKDLMIDWRAGARHFMSLLTDGDIANNQLGWQWVAGTGTDTNPTRIFNPTLQSERFDPDGTYIRRWVPELAPVTTDEIHDPGPLTRAAHGYPVPMVDHREAIKRFKEARGYR